MVSSGVAVKVKASPSLKSRPEIALVAWRVAVVCAFTKLVVPGVEDEVVVIVPHAHCDQTFVEVKPICTPVAASAVMVTLP